ncbi:uncharacterized protein [Oryctolagus cuniculus]|uniref:uncharacterized protein n=1 Tax=Oryctolagus cuniculus TaxID=9986 RepID=UPI003877D0B9
MPCQEAPLRPSSYSCETSSVPSHPGRPSLSPRGGATLSARFHPASLAAVCPPPRQDPLTRPFRAPVPPGWGGGECQVRSGPRLGTAETRAGRLDAPSAAALSVQDGVPPGESVQHPGGAVPRHDIIGEFTTSYRELSRGQSQFNVYEVVNPKKKGKKKKCTNSGTVTLLSLVETEVSFLDYIKGGYFPLH